MVISRAQAEEIAARWARGESERRGYGCEPVLSEFDQGYAVWTRQPPTVLPVPGYGARTVIDRETGVLTTWPSLPVADIAQLYRDHRPARPATVDPSVALLRLLRRRPAPTTAAHLEIDGRLFRAQGAKGDQSITHHPLVSAHLDALDRGARVRGAERHAELIALSEALHTGGRETLDEARAWLINARFGAFLVREQDDPAGGRPARPCETCVATLVDFAVLPWSDLAYTTEWRPPAGGQGHAGQRAGDPGAGDPGAGGQTAGDRKTDGAGEGDQRFPLEVARVLAAGGWTGAPLGASAFASALEAGGGHLRAFPAAERAVAEFAGVRCGRRGPGRRRAIRVLTLDPVVAAASAAAVAEFGEVLGVATFPIGTEGGDAIVVVDERGRMFVLDQGGDWFVGDSLDQGLVALLTGDGPAKRIRDDATW